MIAPAAIALLLFPLSRAHAVCGMPEITDLPITLGINTHGHQVGGMGIVTMTETRTANNASSSQDLATEWSLTLLSPGGLSLFTARGSYRVEVLADAEWQERPDGPTTVETGLDVWRPWLEALPLGRDLRVAFATTASGPETCGGGTTTTRRARQRGETPAPLVKRRWTGPEGPVSATVFDDRIVLHDRLRGYTLTLVAPDRPPLDRRTEE